jgi:hypothetical protein
MIDWIKRKTYENGLALKPDDTITVEYCGDNSVVESIVHVITESQTIDTIALGKITNELGFEDGYVGVFGRTNK